MSNKNGLTPWTTQPVAHGEAQTLKVGDEITVGMWFATVTKIEIRRKTVKVFDTNQPAGFVVPKEYDVVRRVQGGSK